MTTKIAKTSILLRITVLLVAGLLLVGATLPTRVSAADDKTTSSDSKASDSGDDSSAADGVEGIDPKTDPALDSKASCSEKSCPLIDKYVNPAIRLLSALVAIVAVIAIVVGGIEVTTSAGDPQRSASGKNHVRNALIGIVAYVFFYAFLQWLVPGGLI
jgi:hypothetical protein